MNDRQPARIRIAAAAHAFSIDVEDWFHIVGHQAGGDSAGWAALPTRVERNTEVLLGLLQRHRVRASFFVLGWIADTHPRLIATIRREGHEIASHGFAHRPVEGDDAAAFEEDLRCAEQAIGAACGVRPLGYRAPSFSITARSPWAFEILAGRGYAYDSSVFPARRANGGLPGAPASPYRLAEGPIELPVSTIRVFGRRFAFLGGGYLRLLPLRAILGAARKMEERGDKLVLYIHPHDVDPDQPRLALPPRRRFTRYVGLAGCRAKLDRLLGAFRWGPCGELAVATAVAADG